MSTIGIIIGSTRPNRRGADIGAWVQEAAARRDDASFVLIDLRDFSLPHFDQAIPPAMGGTQSESAKAWANAIGECDGFIFVTAEYNQWLPGALKNAIDFVFAEWCNKAAGIVSYGAAGGLGAAGQLRQMCGQFGIADIPAQVRLTLEADFEDMSRFRPRATSAAALDTMLDQLTAWTSAMEPLRVAAPSALVH
ncbi:NADPH-dependent FMN reductase [Jongsikchunia kroppenstedtii]|uniref:NADPH-dependent FMN reductase n=1 Tax=Jongsikchunia kroppenstedtii TaxID=1121721 RepID=UPI000364FE08|nr:NAD(P)H-dependent oxidoreductase [Jongsikchunia kroppenstedtii]